MNASNLLCGLLWAMIRFQFSEAIRRIKLAPRNPRYTKTLILDLDETLIRGEKESNGKESFRTTSFFIHLRPNVVETLRDLEKGNPEGERWELIFWTAGTNEYGEMIENKLKDKYGIETSQVIGRETSIGKRNIDLTSSMRKDIRRLINPKPGKDPNPRTLETMVIVDNRPEHCYPGENTIGIRSWYGFNENIHEKQWLEARKETVQELERSDTWAIAGDDEGEAMKQLKIELDELKGKSVTLERLNKKLQEKKRGESDQMIYYRAQPIMMSRQIEMVREAGRGNQYGKTLVLDLTQDLLVYKHLPEADKQRIVTGKYDEKNDWLELLYEERYPFSVKFKDDAIDTLRTLQQGATGIGRWEFIIWTGVEQKFAAEISEMLSGKGVDIAHVLGASEWDDADYNFERNWNLKDVTRLESKTRPLDSMFIMHNECWPQENIVSMACAAQYLMGSRYLITESEERVIR